MTTSLYSLGAKLFVSVCRSCQAKVSGAIDTFLSTLGVSRDLILGIFAKGNLPLRYISNLPLGVTNEGREAIKQVSGAVAGDSTLQDRGVARYLLSLLFSLVSLPFSFCFSVFYQKLQKKIAFLLVVLSV